MGKITMNELDDSLIEKLNQSDLSSKQDKTDNNLITNDKTVVGAINELFQDVDSGKQLIADAIGDSSITKDSTFQAMSNAIAGRVKPAGTAIAADVLNGKTFINSTGQVLTGTMTSMGTHTRVGDYVAYNDTSIYMGIPAGAYLNSSATGTPEVYIEKTRLDSNLVPENIVSGKSICGVTGSAAKVSNTGVYNYLFINKYGSTINAGINNLAKIGTATNNLADCNIRIVADINNNAAVHSAHYMRYVIEVIRNGVQVHNYDTGQISPTENTKLDYRINDFKLNDILNIYLMTYNPANAETYFTNFFVFGSLS